MKITAIQVWQIDLPLSKPYWLSGGRLKFEQLDSTFVRLDTDAGLSGWGEACPWGNSYLPAHGAGVRAGLDTIASAVIGANPLALDDLNRRIDTQLPGHAYVKSAVDMACWDLLGKHSDMPLWRLLGADRAAAVAVNSSISTGTPAQMLALINEARQSGYRHHSAKVGGTDTALDIARIEAISAAIGDDETVTFDVNRAWTPATAVRVLNSVSARDWVEQPCETLQQCTHVAGRVAQPIMLDECLHNFNDHLSAWRDGSCEGVKVKPNRLGGITRARQVRDFGIAVGWRMHIEDVGGSALADTAAIHLAASTPDENRLASWLCHYHLAIDPVAGQGARNQGGFATPPDLPGIGVEPDIALLDEPFAVYR